MRSSTVVVRLRRRTARQVRETLQQIVADHGAPFDLREAASYWTHAVGRRMDLYSAQQTAAVLINAGNRQPNIDERLRDRARSWGACLKLLLEGD